MTTQAKRSIFALCRMVDQVPMNFELEHRSPKEAVNLFLSLVGTVSELLGKGSEAAKDNHFNLSERKMLEPLLLALMKATGEFLQSISCNE